MDTALLESIYRDALRRCHPERLVAALPKRELPADTVDVVAIGKCAVTMTRAVSEQIDCERIFVAVPKGYEAAVESVRGEAHVTSHPQISDASFAAGEALLRFVAQGTRRILVLLSGGSSAAVEAPRQPFTRDDLVHVNEILTKRHLSIEEINTVRKKLSSIKGGRLGQLMPDNSLTWILSDVRPGALDVVGSGPTLPDHAGRDEAVRLLQTLNDEHCRAIAVKLRALGENDLPRARPHHVVLIADNDSLIAAARESAEARGAIVHLVDHQIESDVESAARQLVETVKRFPPCTLVVAGGEPTVHVRGNGRGGRCFELAARMARLARAGEVRSIGLFGSSDGIDGNTGAGAAIIDPERYLQEPGLDAQIDAALGCSDSFSIITSLGKAIIPGATGNNLRDLYLMART